MLPHFLEFVEFVRSVAYSSVYAMYTRSGIRHYAANVYKLIDSLHLFAPYRQVYINKSMFRVPSVWECDELLSLGHIDIVVLKLGQ